MWLSCDSWWVRIPARDSSKLIDHMLRPTWLRKLVDLRPTVSLDAGQSHRLAPPLRNRTHLVVYLPGCDSCESVYVPSNLWKSSRGPGLTSNEFKADFCPFSTHLIYSFQNSGAPKRKVSRCREVSPWKGKLRILWISQNVTTTYCNNFATWQGFYHSLDNWVPQAARFCWQRWSKMGKRINSSKK